MPIHGSPETGESQCLDEALEDTFPASDPPSQTSPMAAAGRPPASLASTPRSRPRARCWSIWPIAEATPAKSRC